MPHLIPGEPQLPIAQPQQGLDPLAALLAGITPRVPAPLRPWLGHPAFAQLLRFALAGLAVTLLCALVYLAAASVLRIDPLVANIISHGTGVATGYVVHSRFSFRAGPGDHAVKLLRFILASGAAFALNSLWVWLAVHVLHGPVWLPVPAMLCVTPFASFAINRWWVFGR